MKSWKLLPLIVAVIAFASGCAALQAPNTESLLSASGFVTKTPSTEKQTNFYNALPAFDLERKVIKGQTIYVYADKKNEIVYFGNEQSYQKYKALSLKQQISEDNLAAAQMEDDAALDFDSWGPVGGFWD